MTVFGFIAQPATHIFLKPAVTKLAARAYAFDFEYHSTPDWATYRRLLDFAATVRRNIADLRPKRGQTRSRALRMDGEGSFMASFRP